MSQLREAIRARMKELELTAYRLSQGTTEFTEGEERVVTMASGRPLRFRPTTSSFKPSPVSKATLYAYLAGRAELSSSQLEYVLERLRGRVVWEEVAAETPPETKREGYPLR